MARDRSNELNELYELKKEKTPLQNVPSNRPTVVPNYTNDPFNEGFSSVCAMADSALFNAASAICTAMKAMTQHGPLLDIEGALLIADAELSSASASAKAFGSLMGRAKVEVAKMEPFADGEVCALTSKELVLHYATASALLTSLVDRRRLDLTICREALAAHIQELHAPVSLWMCIDGSEGRTPKREERCHRDSKEEGRVRSSGAHKGSVGGGITDEVIHHAHQNIKTAAAAAASGRKVIEGATDKVATTVANTVLSLARRTRSAASGGGVEGLLSPLGIGVANLSPSPISADTVGAISPQYTYTEEERAFLESEREAMLLEERTSNAASAKDIEATISELAHLTSMVQSRVMEQEEQLEGLERTTTEAAANITKAVVELKQPLKQTWSATKQMTAMLWVATLVVLSAHFVIG